MTKRYDVCSPRAGKDDKTFWHRVGTAFETDKGIGVVFDSLPLPDKDGRVSVRLFEPHDPGRTKDNRATQRAREPERATPHPAGSRVDMDDEIPFEMEWR